MLTTQIKERICTVIGEFTGSSVFIIKSNSLFGGSINQAFDIITNKGRFFVKINSLSGFPGMFEKEAEGLEILRSTNVVRIPEVIGIGAEGDTSFLILQFLENSTRNKKYSEQLGESIAGLHRFTETDYGLNHHNYIGSLKQQNKFHSSGIDFLINERWMPMVEIAQSKNLLTTHHLTKFELLYKKISSLIPDEPSSLLHGDLWNGNVITGHDGYAWLIDPAVYYGHRESDLAMTRLFGGFDQEFYDSYNYHFPLLPGWQSRVPLFQLYPLLVHLNLFGMGYLPEVDSVLENYVN